MKTSQQVCTPRNYCKLLKTWCDLFKRTTSKDTGNTLKISRKHIWKETVVLYVIIIHMNPDGDSGGDGEHESGDTKDRSDCSSNEDMDL